MLGSLLTILTQCFSVGVLQPKKGHREKGKNYDLILVKSYNSK